MHLKILFFAIILLLPLSAWALDSDLDGLPDDVETRVLHSSPLHKDVFVEIDWFVFGSRNMKPREGFVHFVKEIFRRAPVANPDGIQGINLHIDLSDEIPDSPAVLGHMEFNGGYNFDDFQAIKDRYFTASRKSTYHYCLFVRDIGDHEFMASGTSGISRNTSNIKEGASDFIVSLGGAWWNYPTPDDYLWTQIGTFIHELGHNLGLMHGGGDSITRKPNHLSVMNYAYQVAGIPFTANNGNRLFLYDYSRRALPALNERSLNERTGLSPAARDDFGVYGARWWHYLAESDSWIEMEVFDAASAVDWDSDKSYEMSVKANLNEDYIYLPGRNIHKFDVLRGYEEWTKLVFNGGLIGNPSNKTSSPQSRQPQCLSFQEQIHRTSVRLQQESSRTATRTVYPGSIGRSINRIH